MKTKGALETFIRKTDNFDRKAALVIRDESSYCVLIVRCCLRKYPQFYKNRRLSGVAVTTPEQRGHIRERIIHEASRRFTTCFNSGCIGHLHWGWDLFRFRFSKRILQKRLRRGSQRAVELCRGKHLRLFTSGLVDQWSNWSIMVKLFLKQDHLVIFVLG